MLKSVKIKISGRVQMVGFRYFTVRHARALGLKGYVRNMEDGSVEVFAAGDADAIGEFIGLLNQGPSSADVKDLDVNLGADPGENFSGFDVRY